MEKPSEKLQYALETIHKRLNTKRVFITGGIGSYHNGFSSQGDPISEAFAPDYILPSSTAYNETCANVGNGMWNWKMFLLTGESTYADQVENVMYNSGISGISLDGKKFRYTNPLSWRGKDQTLLSNDSYERWTSFICYCCPPQMARTMASMNRYIACKKKNEIDFILYGSSTLYTPINGQHVAITEETNFPWDGTVTFTLNQPLHNFTIGIRVPSWSKSTKLMLNGAPITVKPASINRISGNFTQGDVITLQLDMRIRKMKANPFVEAVNNHVAYLRGPLVYCLEEVDIQAPLQFDGISIDTRQTMQPVWEASLLGGIMSLNGFAHYEKQFDDLYTEIEACDPTLYPIKLIPYFAWNNRGIGKMEVWLPRFC